LLDLVDGPLPTIRRGDFHLQKAVRLEKAKIDGVPHRLAVDPDDAAADLQLELLRDAAGQDLRDSDHALFAHRGGSSAAPSRGRNYRKSKITTGRTCFKHRCMRVGPFGGPRPDAWPGVASRMHA